MLVDFTGLSSSIIIEHPKDIDFEIDEIIIWGGPVLVRY
jgi:hypothetical protein